MSYMGLHGNVEHWLSGASTPNHWRLFTQRNAWRSDELKRRTAWANFMGQNSTRLITGPVFGQTLAYVVASLAATTAVVSETSPHSRGSFRSAPRPVGASKRQASHGPGRNEDTKTGKLSRALRTDELLRFAHVGSGRERTGSGGAPRASILYGRLTEVRRTGESTAAADALSGTEKGKRSVNSEDRDYADFLLRRTSVVLAQSPAAWSNPQPRLASLGRQWSEGVTGEQASIDLLQTCSSKKMSDAPGTHKAEMQRPPGIPPTGETPGKSAPDADETIPSRFYALRRTTLQSRNGIAEDQRVETNLVEGRNPVPFPFAAGQEGGASWNLPALSRAIQQILNHEAQRYGIEI